MTERCPSTTVHITHVESTYIRMAQNLIFIILHISNSPMYHITSQHIEHCKFSFSVVMTQGHGKTRPRMATTVNRPSEIRIITSSSFSNRSEMCPVKWCPPFTVSTASVPLTASTVRFRQVGVFSSTNKPVVKEVLSFLA